MKKLLVIGLCLLFVLGLIGGVLCWIAYSNQPTFLGKTRTELEGYDMYFCENLIAEQKVIDRTISACLDMEFYRSRVNSYETLVGGSLKEHYIIFQKENVDTESIAIYFENAETQLSIDYIHRDHPIVLVLHIKTEFSEATKRYTTSVISSDYYTLSPSDYALLLGLITYDYAWDT